MSRVDELLKDLTPAQTEAVRHIDGPLLVLAGPGSGKTRVVTHRMAWLLRHGVLPRQILALTFTNKAADEMQARLAHLAPGQSIWISTFHRFCARLLREFAAMVGLEPNFTIYDAGDSLQALKRTMSRFNLDPAFYTPQQIADNISWAKNNLITPDQYAPRLGNPIGAMVAQIYPAHQAQLLASNAVDFDDLLMHVASLLRSNPEIRQTLDSRYRYVLVDEYQDTNLAQYTIVRALSIDYPNLSVTGDPDQSIYGWRGANLANILEFERDYPQVAVVKLEQNYRSTKRILRVARELIRRNVRRKDKDLFTDNEEGQPVRHIKYPTQREEADGIAAQIAAAVRSGRRRPRDFAILYRMNALSRELERGLRDQGIPYQMVNGVEFYQRKEIKDVLAYLRLLNNPRDDMALQRIINLPARGIGKNTVERLIAHADRRGVTLLEAARESGLAPDLPKRAAVSVARFVALFDRLCLSASRPVEQILRRVLQETGYLQSLEHSENPDDQERLANVEELLTAGRQFDERTPGDGHLEEFLENVCLVNETDAWESTVDCVTMMTLHASKGLEFPVIYLVAFEQGILPHERSVEHPDQIEEERRLLFVGMTRAREELQLSHVTWRDFRGMRRHAVPSPFSFELPREELDFAESPGASAVAEPDSTAEWLQETPLGPEENVWSQSPSESVLPAPRRGRSTAGGLTTADQLIGDAGQKEVPLLRPGMVVLHPEYGLGKVLTASGGRASQTATVEFSGVDRKSAFQKSFVVPQSPLRPVCTPK